MKVEDINQIKLTGRRDAAQEFTRMHFYKQYAATRLGYLRKTPCYKQVGVMRLE
jgi:hypothetical protein